MRKSSRGNPWHDARGRFCSGPQGGGVKHSEKTPEEYEQRTIERFREEGLLKNDKTIRTLSDLQKNGWNGGAFDLEGGSVWSKDGYTLVTAKHDEKKEYDGYTKRVGDMVHYYDNDGNLIASLPKDEADKYKTTKANFFMIRTPDGETYQMKSLEDANKFVEADKEAHFGEMASRFSYCGGIKQPVKITETESGHYFVEVKESHGGGDGYGFLSYSNGKAFFFAYEEDYDDDNDVMTCFVYSHETKSEMCIPLGMCERKNPQAYEHFMKTNHEKRTYKGEQYSHAIFDKSGKIVHTMTKEEFEYINGPGHDTEFKLANGDILVYDSLCNELQDESNDATNDYYIK